MNKAYIICGPTASGKSGLGLAKAREVGGAIINADSMQIYSALHILTSSPTEADKAEVPHFLYNFHDPRKRYSVANFISDCKEALNLAKEKSLVPIIVGGTGMYINALIEGISDIPDVSGGARQKVRDLLQYEGLESVYSELVKLDPIIAARLNPGDTQRICRALEVFLSSGQSIAAFREKKSTPILSEYEIETIYLNPERQALYASCDKRFDQMIAEGVTGEVRDFCAKYPDVNFGATNSLGFKYIKEFLDGSITLEFAIEKSKQETRNYAKRQYTWFNNRLAQSSKLNSSDQPPTS